jgi:hypothetical protein
VNTSGSFVALSHGQLVVLADLVAERVAVHLAADASPPAARPLVDAAALARALGVSRQYVYLHAAELGARRVGKGSRPRLRFDVDAARDAMDRLNIDLSHGANVSAGAESARSPRPGRRRSPNGAPKPGSILGIRGRKTPAGKAGR